MAEENDDYEMMKILINHPTHARHHDFIADLNKVDNCICRFRSWIDSKSVKFLCAILSSTRVTVTEQFQYYFMKRLIVELTKNNMEQAGFLMSCVFGSGLPYYMIRGDGRDQSMRDDDAQKVEEQLTKFQNFFRAHKEKLNAEVHFL